jgi:hypothetical protein
VRGPRRADLEEAAMRWVGAVALCAVACGGVEDVSGDAADETIESGVPHALPFARGESAAPAASPKLVYYGGPVLEKATVVAVLWGPSVDAEVAARIGDFYKAVVSSSYFSWLSEYDSARQHIGHGSLAGVFTIAPSKKGRALTDAQIEKELAAQIRKRALPAADANTIYLIHFPPGVRITMGGSASCQAGGFCGYHSTFRSGARHLRYAVLPDMSAGSGCDIGCGGGAPFAAVTSVASHELVEATTDPDVGLAKRLAAPLAWYDRNNGEIGDICAGHDGTLRAGGSVWTVQKQWSNKAGACVLTGH